MTDRITKRDVYGRPLTMRCDCGTTIHLDDYRPGADAECNRCGREYNSAGQALAPRSEWGHETGETAQDYYRGYNDPGHAFDGDY